MGTEVRGLILFDIDGTLVQAGDKDHQIAFVTAMKQVYGRPATLDGVPLAGMLDSQIARLALSRQGLSEAEIDADLARMIDAMGVHYAEAIAEQSRIERRLPGVVEIAERLRAERFALGVLTGNAREVARVKLSSAGILDYFPIGAFGDSARERHHLVQAAWDEATAHFGHTFSAAQTVLIGDTPRDIAAAHENRANAVAVATGRYSVADLTARHPEAVFPDLSDTTAITQAIEAMVG
jgi:phosphoglycolate phosphatase-like HAD superfamily hydrolase